MIRYILTILWISVVVGPFVNDFNDTHLFNPGWMPHARLHMMHVFTTSTALAFFGLYLCWGPASARIERLKLSALLGMLYAFAFIVSALTMPLYGGSMHASDSAPRAVQLGDGNFIVFICVALIFAGLGLALFRKDG